MNGVPALRRRLASCSQRRGLSASGGPFENHAAALRHGLVNSLKRQHVAGLRAIRLKTNRG